MNRAAYNSSFKYVIEYNKEDGRIVQVGRILEKIDEETLLIEGYGVLDVSLGDVSEIKDPPIPQKVYELDFDYKHRDYDFFKNRLSFIGSCMRSNQ